jgi:hypothetical protein
MTGGGGARILAFIVGATVLAAVVAGIVILGSPKRQRQLKLDERRIEDLIDIQRDVNFYWQRHKALPPDLVTLSGEPGHGPPLKDPERGNPYELEITGAESCRLCAVFAFDSSEAPEPSRYYSTESWTHGAGRHCFDLSISPRSGDDNAR